MSDFPILKKITYLDNAATTQKPKTVIKAFEEYYTKNNANPGRGLYSLSINAQTILDESRKKVAEFINAEKEEIIFTKSATEGLNMLSLSLGEELGRWQNVVVTELEHHANFVPWQQVCKEKKAKFIMSKKDEITKNIDARTHILALTGMSNVTGEILDIKKIIREVKEKNPKTIIVIDATQLVAHRKIDVQEIGADFIVFSAHKLYGPTGVGVVYGKFELLKNMRPFLYGGHMIQDVSEKECTWAEVPEKFEAGTLDVAGIYAFGKALDYLKKNDAEKLFQKEEELKEYALKELKKVEHVNIIGHDSNNYGPIISMHITDIHPHDLAEICGRENMCIRAGHHCAKPLMKSLDLNSTARISLSFYNTKKDIDVFVKAIKKARKIING